MFPLSIYNTSISSSSHKGTVHSRTVLRKRTVERAEIYLRCPQRLEYRSRLHFYSALIEQRTEYCLTVCLSVCPRAYLWNYMSDRHQIFHACYLYLWLDPSVAALRYVMNFRFYGWRHVCTRYGTGSQFVTQLPSDPGIQRPGDPVDPVTLFYI